MSRARPDLRIVLDSGHGGTDPGCVWPADDPQMFEKDLVVRFTAAAEQEIKDHLTLACYQTRPWPPDKSVSLERRVELANHWDADAFVSFHVNTAKSDRPRGMWIIHDDLSERGKALAYAIQKQLRAQGFDCDTVVPDGTPYVDERQLKVVSRTRMPAVLIELGFITNAEDRVLLQGGRDARPRVGKAVCKGIELWAATDPNLGQPVPKMSDDEWRASVEERLARLEFLAEV